MSSTNDPSTISQSAIIKRVTSSQVKTLQSQLIDLSSNYWVMKGQMGGNPRVDAFAAPDWYDLDTRALNLQKSVHSRSLSGVDQLQEAEFEALETIRIEIGEQITALRAQPNDSGLIHTSVLPPSQSQLPTRHSRSNRRQRTVTAAPVTSPRRQSNIRKRSTKLSSTRVNTSATKPHRLFRTDQEEDEIKSRGKVSTTVETAKFSSTNETYVPEFPGLVNFPAPIRSLGPAIPQSTGKIRKPILAFCKLPRRRIALDGSEGMPWTTGVTTPQEIWESRFGGPTGILSLGVSDEVNYVKNCILEKRALAKAEKDRHSEVGEEAAEKKMGDSDSDYIP